MYSLFGRTPSVISFLSLPEICWGDQPSFNFSSTKPQSVGRWRRRYFWWEWRFRAAVGDLSLNNSCRNDTRGRAEKQDTQRYVQRLVGYVVGRRRELEA